MRDEWQRKIMKAVGAQNHYADPDPKDASIAELERELALAKEDAQHHFNESIRRLNALVESDGEWARCKFTLSALKARVLMVIEQAEKAMQPIASHVHNDNFDLTVNRTMPAYETVVAIWHAHRAARSLANELKEE